MKKGNMIDLTKETDAEETVDDSTENAATPISKELEIAIQNLIKRMRESGPLRS